MPKIKHKQQHSPNGAGTVHSEALEVLKALEEEPEETFDSREWALPTDFSDELMANAALEHLKIIQTSEVNIIANKSVHQDDEVRRLVLVQSASMRALQEIKHRYPGALKIVKEIASDQARQAKTVRASREQG